MKNSTPSLPGRESSPRVLVAVLAAGASKRMGSAKQLLNLGGEALASRACRAALESSAAQVAIVTGCARDEVVGSLAGRLSRGPGIRELYNPLWQQGQGTSVALAAAYAREQGFDALVVTVADQPNVSAKHIDGLIGSFGAETVALRSTVGNRMGNPCLFGPPAFAALEALMGDEGARRLFANGTLRWAPVFFDDPSLFDDIDTPQDYARALGKTRVHEKPPAFLSPPFPTPPMDPADFPLLARPVGAGREGICYLDSAATALVAEPVRAAVDSFLLRSRANVHRGAHLLAEEATDAFERAREHVSRFICSESPDRVIFTHGTTEAINLVAQCWGTCRLKPGDAVVLTEEAHHAAIVPWQMLAQRAGIELRWVRLRADGLLDEASWSRALQTAPAPRLAVLTHTSNVLGFEQPLFAQMAREAREAGALIAVDAAQAAGHVPLTVDGSAWDFVAFSAHKMHALTGLGVLWCSQRALDQMVPAWGGGGMIERVTTQGFSAAPAPQAFEAGTPAIEAAVSLDAALSYIEDAGIQKIADHTSALCRLAAEALAGIAGVRILGPVDAPRTSLVSFEVDGVHPHDLSAELSDRGIMVRAGHHCAMPLHAALGVRASVRASFAGHSSQTDVERLVAGIKDALARRL